jgi:hypothetical protein
MVDLTRATIVIGRGADRIEVLAARELQRYLRLIGAGHCLIATAVPRRGVAVVLGTPTSSPIVARELAAAGMTGKLGDEGYRLRTTRDRVILASSTPRGALWAAYGTLERLGVGFFLGGDALAGAGPPRLPAGIAEVHRPAFAVRGSLPWYNFLDSPTTWDRDDYRYFFDQMAKMRMNFVGFHSYDSEPFCAYDWQGKLVGGEPLVTARTYGWGTVEGMGTRDFGFGTGDFFDGPEFGSKSAILPGTREQKIRRQQALLADGLNYARSRGLRVCVGFEVNGDPTDPSNQERLEARLKALVRAYPMLDYVWIWQSEGLGAGSQPSAAGSAMDHAVERYRNTFAYLKDPARIHEAVRVMLYSRLAHAVLKRIAPKVRMALSGWGGDSWMRFSDFYEGLDKTLPQDVIFAALDNIDPTSAPRVAAVYGKLSPRRERWPIPWWESDGGYSRRDQWGPQCNAAPFLPLCRDALAKGCQGMLAIHWRTRDVEEAAALQARFAWNPKLTYEGFYRDFARACYGARWADAMSAIHRELEALGPRYTGAYGQVECGGFEWFSGGRLPVAENLRKLDGIRSRLDALRREMASAGGGGLARLDWLITTIAWLTRYDAAAMILRPGGPVDAALADAREALQRGDSDQSRTLVNRAAEAFCTCGLGDAMRTYPWKMTTCGEWGTLATINVKAWAAYRRIAQRIRQAGGDPGPEDRSLGPVGEPRIVMRTPPSIVERGKAITVQAVIAGTTAPALLRYRTPGQPWHAVPMKPVYRLTRAGTIPAEAVTDAGIEFGIQIPSHRVVGPVHTATVLPIAVGALPVQAASFAPKQVTGLEAEPCDICDVRIHWHPTRPGAAYAITRNPAFPAGPKLHTRLTEYWDTGLKVETPYRYTVAEIGSDDTIGPLATVEVRLQRPPAPQPPVSVQAFPGAGKVRLMWASDGRRALGYRVYRDGKLLTPEPVVGLSYLDLSPGEATDRSYTVSVVDRAGQEGPQSAPVTARANPKPTGPDFTAALTPGSAPTPDLAPPAVLTSEGLDTRDGGYGTFANRPTFHLSGEFAVAFRFRAESTTDIPVLVSCGEFSKWGWFVQILGGRIRFSLGGSNVLDAGWIEPARWYRVACTFDGRFMHVYLDGAEVGSREASNVDFQPWTGPLYVGQYHFLEGMYQFRGVLADLRIYAFAPAPDEWRR